MKLGPVCFIATLAAWLRLSEARLDLVPHWFRSVRCHGRLSSCHKLPPKLHHAMSSLGQDCLSLVLTKAMQLEFPRPFTKISLVQSYSTSHVLLVLCSSSDSFCSSVSESDGLLDRSSWNQAPKTFPTSSRRCFPRLALQKRSPTLNLSFCFEA